MAWVYILRTKENKYYVGSTVNLEKRFTQHVQGHTHSTKRLGVESIVLSQQYKTLKDARSVEHKIKRLKRKDYIEKIIQNGYIKLTPDP